MPTFSPTGGTYSSDQSVVINCETEGAIIYCTTGGGIPSTTSTRYSQPILIAGNGTRVTIKAMCTKAGMISSPSASATYTINYSQVSTPQFSPAAGMFSSDQAVEISCSTPGATIYYTTDGSPPGTSSAVYSSPVAVAGDETSMRITAIAAKTGMTTSTTASGIYVIWYDHVAGPTFLPPEGTYGGNQSITIACATPGAAIHYTTDGTVPTASSPVYASPIPLSLGQSTTIGAFATKEGMVDSQVKYGHFAALYQFVDYSWQNTRQSTDCYPNLDCVFSDGSKIYVGVNDFNGVGVLVSSDGGSSWVQYSTANGLGNNWVLGIYASGSSIYVATVAGLSISNDGGATWTNYTTANGIGNGIVNSVYASGSSIYAATGGGLSVSTDAGVSWTNYTSANGLGSLVGEPIFSVYVSGSSIYAGTNYGTVSISNDGGANWTNYSLSPTISVGSVCASGSMIYAATTDGLWVSSNAGASWTRCTTSNGLGCNSVIGVCLVGSTVYAATWGGLSVSTNAGASWTNHATVNGLGSNGVNGVCASGSSIYAATDGGLSVSTNGGVAWTNYTLANGLGSNQVKGVYASGPSLYAATTGGVSVSSNGGASWTNHTTLNGLGGNNVVGVCACGETIYAATCNWGLSVSTDGGSSWTNYTTANGLGANQVRGVYASGSSIYAATAGGMSVSMNAGASWTNYTTANGLRYGAVCCVYASGSIIGAGTINGLSVSYDGGLSWKSSVVPSTDGVCISGTAAYVATESGVSVSQ